MSNQIDKDTLLRGTRDKDWLYNSAPNHDGMRTRSRATGNWHCGADELSRVDADPKSPMNGPPRGKVMDDVKAVIGQRSRSSTGGHEFAKQVGLAVLADAVQAACPNTKAAFAHDYGVGSLPSLNDPSDNGDPRASRKPGNDGQGQATVKQRPVKVASK